MVGLTCGAVATVINGGKGAETGASIGAALGTASVASGTKQAIGGATGTALASGAIKASTEEKTSKSAIEGSVAAGTAASGIGISGYAGSMLAAGVTTTGIGLLAVGMEHNPLDDKLTYDCWKKVVHNKSKEPSNGILLKDLISHPFVLGYSMTGETSSDFPYIVIENIWKEKFEIQFLYFHQYGKIICHANPLSASK